MMDGGNTSDQATLKQQILTVLAATPGLTDRELADRIQRPEAKQQSINQVGRALADAGQISRPKRPDGKLSNYPNLHNLEKAPFVPATPEFGLSILLLSEDDLKRNLQAWVDAAGWQVQVIWGRGRGIDIEAQRGGQRWIIEAKGSGTLDAMSVNYFLAILGELLQRMTDTDARYSIALPDMKQFRRLWRMLPSIAKARTGITALFVAPSGEVSEELD